MHIMGIDIDVGILVVLSFALIVLIFFVTMFFHKLLKKYRHRKIDLLKEQISDLQKENYIFRSKKISLEHRVADQTEFIHTLKRSVALLKEENGRLKVSEKKATDELIALKEHHRIFLSNLTVYPYLAAIQSDLETGYLKRYIKALDYGDSAARREKIATIREIQAETKAYLQKYKIYEYNLHYLLKLFPSLQDVLDVNYFELPEAVKDSKEIPTYDPIRDYLSKEEYQSLNESARNQLALDNYIRSHRKTKWQIGRDYELFVGWQYQKGGWHVDYYGSAMRLEDMGRDLILERDGLHLIIQCKYWSERKQIHEKHIFQLYGSLVCYSIEHCLPISSVVGIFVTSASLSIMARKVAKALHIQFKENYPIRDFPRIKCNIGRDSAGNKTHIYHLPMDQQYDQVKLLHPGEFLASTVKEAEAMGFRRAYKWHPGNE